MIDVGILAVGLSKNPATSYCLEVIDDAVRGRIRAPVSYTVVFGTHYILTRFYNVSPKEDNDLLRGLLSSEKIVWYGHIDEDNVENSLENSEKHDLDAWDGYILHLMETNQIRIIYTLDIEHFGKRLVKGDQPHSRHQNGGVEQVLRVENSAYTHRKPTLKGMQSVEKLHEFFLRQSPYRLKNPL
ncbi:MAG: hypothetical protein ACE5Z5_02935 [Candidatus Bathyarchaeia archaeon]